MTYYRYIFEDGYFVFARGFSANELKIEEAKHGKLVSKVRISI